MAWYKLIQEFYFNAPVKIAALTISHLYVYDMGYRSSEQIRAWADSPPTRQLYTKMPDLSVVDDK